MSKAIDELEEFLAISPSVVFPQDVYDYLPAIKAENKRLRELGMYAAHVLEKNGFPFSANEIRRELGI